MGKSDRTEMKMIEFLHKASLDAFKHEHYLQSAVILFQTTEFLLRILISGMARGKGVGEKIRKEISDEEKSFHKLVLYLNLLEPKNALLGRLYSYGKRRNKIIHDLLEGFKTVSQYEKALREFCLEGIRLNDDLKSMMT